MKRVLITISLLLTLISCSKPKVITLNNEFNPKEAAYVLKNGNNTISGESFLKTRGGEVKTCAGEKVGLLPVNDYSKERLKYIYGNLNSGYSTFNHGFKFKKKYPLYFKYMRQTFCNSNGGFVFKNVPDGDYFVLTRVLWERPSGYGLVTEGGFLMKRVKISGGEKKHIYVLGQ